MKECKVQKNQASKKFTFENSKFSIHIQRVISDMSNAKMNVMNKSRSQNDNKVWVVTRKRKEPVNNPGVCEATESRRTTGSLRCQ